MKKRKGYSAEKSRKFRERKAEQGKLLFRRWATPEEIELVKWALLSENYGCLKRIMEKIKGDKKMRGTRQKEKAELFDSMRDMTEEYEEEECEEEYEEEREDDERDEVGAAGIALFFSPRAQEAWRRGWEEREREGD